MIGMNYQRFAQVMGTLILLACIAAFQGWYL
jgi:hypothetical protein